MKKQIMKRAWEIYRTLTGDHIAKLSMALREAWAEAKGEAVEAGWNVTKLIDAGAKRWQKYGKDRIYLSGAAEAIKENSGYIYIGSIEGAYIDMMDGKVYGLRGRYYDAVLKGLAAYAA